MIACECECPFSTFTDHDLLEHYQTVHLTGYGEQWPCQITNCQFTTNKKGQLKSHYKTHLNVRPFLCDFCEKSFKRCHDLSKHMKRKHGKTLDSKMYRRHSLSTEFGRKNSASREVQLSALQTALQRLQPHHTMGESKCITSVSEEKIYPKKSDNHLHIAPKQFSNGRRNSYDCGQSEKRPLGMRRSSANSEYLSQFYGENKVPNVFFQENSYGVTQDDQITYSDMGSMMTPLHTSFGQELEVPKLAINTGRRHSLQSLSVCTSMEPSPIDSQRRSSFTAESIQGNLGEVNGISAQQGVPATDIEYTEIYY